MAETEEPHFVGKKEELMKAKRTFATLAGRDVLIIYHQGGFHAMDSYCYHAGGPLQNGDIEECDGRPCIICPKHKYKIALASGEGMYKSPDSSQQKRVTKWFSKGVKQRVHAVTEADGDVYVRLSKIPNWLESDYFQGEKGPEARARAQAADKTMS